MARIRGMMKRIRMALCGLPMAIARISDGIKPIFAVDPSVGGDVPILGSVEDGNASDKTLNRGILNQVSSGMAAFDLAPDVRLHRLNDSALP